MAKKRRHAASRAAASRQISFNAEATERKLQQLERFYGHLSADVVEIPKNLQHTMLLHSIVALLVQNALMLAESVSMEQIIQVVGSAIWIARNAIVMGLLPHIALRNDNSSRLVFWRSVIHCFVLSGLGVAFYFLEMPLCTLRSLIFLVVSLLDGGSIYLVWRYHGRLTRRQIALTVIEITVVAGFSAHFNHGNGLIYDQWAFVLTAATTFVHVLALLFAEYIALHCFTADTNGRFAKAKKRGAKLMEDLWQSIDRFEPEQLLSGPGGLSKRKKSKNKSRGNKGANMLLQQENFKVVDKQSVFREPQVQFALLTLFQTLLLLSQVLLSAFVLYSWEMMSVIILSSSHVLLTLGRVRRKLLARCSVSSGDLELPKFKNE
ncbi:hypothetical protein PHYBOEH_001310 [Phytophthora boehmeriae]|uniref:Transmembrane protein n=1 Tax=Phytophthora boehmeriae TaxID=109152 RepID=A0A8T1WSH0_9STRA|nr:hypothetical protein PHYBOEH_001310 [Phytophthora boehmeriae]